MHEPLPAIPRSATDDHGPEAVAARQALCVSVAGRPLPHLAGTPVDPREARGKIENAVGFAQVPLGIAGPLLVDTSVGTREVLVPLATTEGAMVASYSRGMKALRAGGPVRSRVTREGLSQHPVLVFADAEAAGRARLRVLESRAELERRTAATTSHGRLIDVQPELLGRRLVVRMVFSTADAIGINMAARASDDCSAYLAEITAAEARYVHGEDVEKRASARALVEGRGRSVVCEAVLTREVLAQHLRVTPEQLVAIHRTYQLGFARLGTQNQLVQSANGLAAAFLACGQDVAYVTESATGFLDFEVRAGGELYASATLPSMLVGTVGGGSGQGTAAECLDLLGVRIPGGANVLAEILCATVLAGDLSLLASFCTHEFVAAHERLGRNRPR